MAGPCVEVAASTRPCDVYLVKAWRVCGLGEPVDVMNLEEVLVPQPDAGQLLVRVLGAAANFADALVCRGLYQVKPPLPFTPGLELW